MRGRLVLLLLLATAWVVGIGWRLYHIQIELHEHFCDKAERQQQRIVEVEAPRGAIYDSRGRELAISIEVESAFAVPTEIPDAEETSTALAEVLGGDAKKYAKLLESDREFVWIARQLDRPVSDSLRERQLEGVYFFDENKRYYPLRQLASQLLGYVGTDNHGLSGLELAYDDEISGRAVRRTIVRDARRGSVLYPQLSFAEAEPGNNLHLTLDASLQHIAERELSRAIGRTGAEAGTVVMLDPRDSAVLAMASYPGYDPNRFAQYPASCWRNRAVMDAYEPGSTFKMITAAAALEYGIVDPSDRFDCEMGGITLADTFIGDHKPFGILSFREVIARSSNVGAVKTALLVGDRPFHQTIAAFGFGRPTGIDLPGESAGILRPIERWSRLSKAYMAFGQGISVTPIQLANAFAALANGGTLHRPYVVAGVERDGKVAQASPVPMVIRQPLSSHAAISLERLLEGVVSSGTGREAALRGYRVAGKTGTAQKSNRHGYLTSSHVASFVGFAPARDPVLVCLVLLDGPKTSIHASDVAAPVFAAIVRPSLLYLGIPPDRDLWPRWEAWIERRPTAPPRASQAAQRMATTAVPSQYGSGQQSPRGSELLPAAAGGVGAELTREGI